MSVFGSLAKLVEYPGPDFAECLEECIVLSTGEFHSSLCDVREQLRKIGLPALQELYIETFDFHSETSPYVGHHLFGEDIRRSLFMAELRGQYRQLAINDGAELPDHLGEVLRFIGAKEPDEETAELVQYCLVPAIAHMLRAAWRADNPYPGLLRAVLFAVKQEYRFDLPHEAIAWIPFSSSSFPTSR